MTRKDLEVELGAKKSVPRQRNKELPHRTTEEPFSKETKIQEYIDFNGFYIVFGMYIYFISLWSKQGLHP